jgi:hypothetical protein
MHKILGYILAGLGVVGLAAGTFAPSKFQEAIGLGTGVADTTIMIASVIVVAVGLLFIVRGSTPQVHEVPIYHGKNVVGYRRVGK